MTKMLLTGIAAAVIAFSAIPAHAGVGDEISLGRLSGTVQLAQSGAALVDFVEGRPVVAKGVAPASLTQSDEQVDRYYDGSVLLTVAMLLVVAIAFAGFAAANRTNGRRDDEPQPGRRDWKTEVMGMLESDLTNLDGLKPGLSR